MDVNHDWCFCVVGNVKVQHTDETGAIFYGTKAFSGGTKVYIDDKTWGLNEGMANVIGLNRFGRYAVESIPAALIENIRAQKVFKPKVLNIMSYLEALDGWVWRGRTSEDQKAVKAFAAMWNNP